MRVGRNINFEDYALQMAANEGGRIHTPSHWVEDIAERLLSNGEPTGDKLPWSKTHDHVRLRPGELSLWAGMNAHRKSMLLGWIVCHLANTKNVGIASLEMKPAETLLRMCKQCAGTVKPAVDFVSEFINWGEDKFFIYDELDKVAWNRIIGFIYYCAKELKCSHIVIDSLTKCGIPQGDGAGEKEFIDRLQWAAKALNTHIHLVCHVRKPQHSGEEYIPNKFDVRGVGELTDLCDNLFITWKDKRREDILIRREIHGAESLSVKEVDYLKDSCDQKLIVAKQRHGDFEGTFNFFFHRGSLQFVPNEDRVMPFKFNFAERLDYSK